jgi:TRAP-type C4-dicarboxylate transport system permease small subunit
VYRVERAIVIGALVVMSVVVFLDVVHRLFAAPGSAATVLVSIANLLRFGIEPGTPAFARAGQVAPFVWSAVFVGLGYLGVRMASPTQPTSRPRALAYALLGTLLVYGLVRGMVFALPNGLIWSQPLALVLTLWVGFIGASMCTYDDKHLKVEAVQRFLPDSLRHYVVFVSGLLTTAACIGLMWLSLRYVVFNYEEYAATQGQGGLFVGLDVPKYLCFAALPVAFTIMAARFAGRAVLAWEGELPTHDPIADLLDDVVVPPLDLRAPSETPTEVSKVEVRHGPLPPSEVATDAVKVGPKVRGREPGVPLRQSQVPTDPHRIVPSVAEGDDDSDASGGDR